MKSWSSLFALAACLMVSGCAVEPTNQANKNTNASPVASATVSPSPADNKTSSTQSLTLPVLDAFFADDSFAATLKTRLQLNDEQVSKLKELAHSETVQLNEENMGQGERESSTARAAATEKIGAIIGKEKTEQLAELVGELWSGPPEAGADKNAAPNSREQSGHTPNAVPKDSRIVVNIPA